MPGASTISTQAVLDRTSETLASGADGARLGTELFSFATTLDEQHALRRALTEPAAPAAAKTALIRSLLGGKAGDETVSVVGEAVGRRWTKSRDLADALEEASVTAHVAVADGRGELDTVEDNLFRFGRIAEGSQGLRDVLTDAAAPAAGKRALVADLVGTKVDATTRTLLEQAVTGRRRSLVSTLALYQRLAAARRDSMVATVWVAAPLTEEHKQRLAEALSEQHQRPMHLNVVVDPSLLGGARVAVGDEVLDSTVESRLKQAQRRLER
ncbi:MAG: F0F1 ATP synthase subunit delta [Nocardioidaceae bacterium]|nr:F0F1 ATP synthase subunit delta [Nocardioidaceae bacterium]